MNQHENSIQNSPSNLPKDGGSLQNKKAVVESITPCGPGIDPGDGQRTELVTELASVRTATPGPMLGDSRPQAPGYDILRQLGSGAFGEVWLAREEATGIRVAIKFFAHGTGQQWKQLQDEVKQLALLDSVKGIVQLKDVCHDASPPYYVMAYAENGSLADRLEKGPLKLAEAVDTFRQVTAALAYVHTKGIRHCDLKPANILLDACGHPMIADFGQAHLSSDALPVLGTFFYMAPEQADLSKQIPDTRWDVYGLGALFYAMLTGRPPRETADLRDQMKATAELSHRLRRYRDWIPKAPPPGGHRQVCGMDRALAHIIDRCLEVDPKQRLPNAGAVLAALELRNRHRRQRPLMLFGLAAPLLLLGVMTVAQFSTNEATIGDAEQNLTEQLLESDRNSARLVANAVQENLQNHLNLLYSSAINEPGLPGVVVKRDRKALEDLLRRLLGRSLRANFKYSQAAVSDSKGHVLAIVNVKNGQLAERDPATLDCKQFAWRDWFSGEGDKWDEMHLDAPRSPSGPITVPHVSDPYVSLPDKFMLVNISIPVLTPGKLKAPPVGVLTASLKLDDINHWLLDVDMKDGFAVLLDQRRFCLLHQNSRRIQPENGKTAPRFDFSPLEERIQRDRAPDADETLGGKIENYVDPVNGRVYLAGYAPMRDKGFDWVALVQHDRDAVLKPIAKLRGKVRTAGWRMLGVAGIVTTALWGWLFWTLRRTESLHG